MRFLVLFLLTMLIVCVLSLQLDAKQWKILKMLLDKKEPSEDQLEIEKLSLTKDRLDDSQRSNLGLKTLQPKRNNSPYLFVYETERYKFYYNTSDLKTLGPNYVPTSEDNVDLPKTVDWVKRGAVTPVRRQGQCDSSYAFAAAGALEGLLYIKVGELVQLSVQNIIDCSVDFHNSGCEGGTIEKALRYVAANHGIDPESIYKYEGRSNDCRINRQELKFVCVGYKSLVNGDEKALQSMVAEQPVAVRLRVCVYDFLFYKDGIYSDNCSYKNRITVSALIVGYGSNSEEDYWLVKNSWGTDWGMKGYMQLARNKGNQCGVASDATYPYMGILNKSFSNK